MVAPADSGPPRGPKGTAPERPVGAEGVPGRHPGSQGDPGSRRRLGWVGLGVAALSFLCGLMVSTLLVGTYVAARGLDEEETKRDLGFALLSAAGIWVGFLALPLLWSRRHGGPSRLLGLSARWVDLPLGLAVGLASTIVTAIVSALALTKGEQDALELIAREQVDRAQGAVAVVLLFIAICLVTPVAEELFFRGLLFRSLQGVTGVVVALGVMGLIFGLLHYQFESMSGRVLLVQLGMLTLFGIALGVVAYRTGRLGAAIVAHAVFNSVTVVSLLAER